MTHENDTQNTSIAAADEILLDRNLFEREAILATASRFTNQYYIGVDFFNEYSIKVSIQPKDNIATESNIAKIFYNELIEQQVKCDLQKKFGKLREMIVEQAFYPLEKK
jgi:His-Xaa-Ser system protein HxsD